MHYVDLTHTFDDGMPVYPGDPNATLVPAASLDTDGYTDHKLETHMHVGTHMDAPLHMVKNGKRISQIDVDHFFGPGVLIDVRNTSLIDDSVAKHLSIPKGAIVLLYTGFGEKYRTPAYYEHIPKVDPSFAHEMIQRDIKILGMDVLGPDDPPFETHKILLGANILILENLVRLDKLLGITTFDVIALPAKLEADAAPARVIARIP